MKTPRKTTLEERIQIVKECIANDYDYGQSAITHSVSYQQVYGWVADLKSLGRRAWRTGVVSVRQNKCLEARSKNSNQAGTARTGTHPNQNGA